jgi:DNA-binding transcriptional MerR regulator
MSSVKPYTPRNSSRLVEVPPERVQGEAREQGLERPSTIRIVAKQTGLPMETLRAWERRYGFPKPERRPGSNRRLYAAADIERLLLLKGAIENGYRIGDVVTKTIDELIALGQGASVPSPISGERAVPRPAVRTSPHVQALAFAASEQMIATLLGHLRNDDLESLDHLLRQLAATLGPKAFVVEIAHPFAARVGSEWSEGNLSVRHEHAATQCLSTRLRSMLSTYQDIPGHPTILLTTLPGEPHGLALEMVAVYMIPSGAKPRLLGVNTPVQDIVEAAEKLNADVIGLTVTPVVDANQCSDQLWLLRRALDRKVAIWLGGAGAPRLGLALDDQSVHLTPTWSSIDDVLARWRQDSSRR